MSKGIIVVNMPEKCEDCTFSNPDGDYCPFHGEVSYPEYGSKKPSDCPIRPMPERWKVCGKYPQPGEPVPSYRIGWNACLDKIERK